MKHAYQQTPTLEPNGFSASHGVPSIVRDGSWHRVLLPEQPRDGKPASYSRSDHVWHERESPTAKSQRIVPSLPLRVGTRTRISEPRLGKPATSAGSGRRKRVIVRCDCGRLDSIDVSNWRGLASRCAKTCRDCYRNGRG